jgi:hypothetical protein
MQYRKITGLSNLDHFEIFSGYFGFKPKLRGCLIRNYQRMVPKKWKIILIYE